MVSVRKREAQDSYWEVVGDFLNIIIDNLKEQEGLYLPVAWFQT